MKARGKENSLESRESASQGQSNLMMTEEEEVLWIINTFFCVHGMFSHAGIAREKTYREPKPFCLLSPSQNNLILLFSLYSTLSSLLLSSYVSPVCCLLCEKMKCIRVEEWVGFLSAVARSWLSGNARALLLCVWRKSCSFAFSDIVLSPLFKPFPNARQKAGRGNAIEK